MSTTMSLKERLNEALNSYIAKRIESSEEILAERKKELEENFIWNFESNSKQVYQRHLLLAHLRNMEGPDDDDPIEMLTKTIERVSGEYIVKSGISTSGSILSTLTSAWKQEIQFIFINILKEWKQDLELIRDAKPCREIPVNFWDDYDEDDEKGTYAYIEDGGKTTVEFKEEALHYLAGVMNNDMKIMGAKYKEGDKTLDTDPNIDIRSISYDNLDKLVKELQGMKLKFKDIPFRFYSES